LPTMPELIDDILQWRPVTYQAYFSKSVLPGRTSALEAYRDLDAAFRRDFEAVVADLDRRAVGAVVAIGSAADALAEKEPQDINVIHPLRDGVIADLDATAEMLHGFLRKAGSSGPLRANALVCVPGGATWVERRSVAAALEARRRYSVQLIDEPVAAAAGAGLDLAAGAGGFIVDIGGGTTEVAAVAGWRVVRALSLRKAGNAMDEAIVAAARTEMGLIISQRAARQLKMTLGVTGGGEGGDWVTIVAIAEDSEKGIVAALGREFSPSKAIRDSTAPEVGGDIVESFSLGSQQVGGRARPDVNGRVAVAVGEDVADQAGSTRGRSRSCAGLEGDGVTVNRQRVAGGDHRGDGVGVGHVLGDRRGARGAGRAGAVVTAHGLEDLSGMDVQIDQPASCHRCRYRRRPGGHRRHALGRAEAP